MKKLKISVFIIAQNEEDRIPFAIKSVIDWVDEVIVIDSGSTDNTVKIAEKLGARVVFNEWNGYGPQKVFGEGLCKNDWILNIDADEEITSELREEISAFFADGKQPPLKAYELKVKTLYPHQKTLPKLAVGMTKILFYNKNYAGFKSSKVHDSVEIKAGYKYKQLKGRVVHRSYRSHEDAVRKINSYTSMQAIDLQERGKRPPAIKLILTPFFAFFKYYILKGYIFMGVDGFFQSYMYSFARTLRLAKLRERYQDTTQYLQGDDKKQS